MQGERAQFDRMVALAAVATVGMLFGLQAEARLLPVIALILLTVVIFGTRDILPVAKGQARALLVPVLLTAGNLLFWRMFPDGRVGLMGGVVYGSLFLLELWDQRRRVVQGEAATSPWLLQVLAYLACFMLFTALYHWKPAAPWLAGATFAVALLGASVLLESEGVLPEHSVRSSAVIGVAIAQVAWALGYWPLLTFQGGLVLLAHLYVMLGLVRAHRARRFGAWLAAEYLLIGGLAAGVVIWQMMGATGAG